MVIPGIIVSASRTRPKATKIALMCSNCNDKKDIYATNGYSHVIIPLKCSSQQSRESIASAQGEACPLDPFVILPDRCTYVDCQVTLFSYFSSLFLFLFIALTSLHRHSNYKRLQRPFPLVNFLATSSSLVNGFDLIFFVVYSYLMFSISTDILWIELSLGRV